MARVRIEGKGIKAIIRDTARDVYAAAPTVDASALRELEERGVALAAQKEELRRRADDFAARLAATEAALARTHEESDTAVDRLRQELVAAEERFAQERGAMADRWERVVRERDHLRRAVDTDLPQGEAKRVLIEALLTKGEEHRRGGNLLDAFHLFRRVLRLDPAHVGALKNVAAIYYSAGLLGPTAEALRGVVELDPSQTKAAESLAAVEERIRRRGGV
jgi:tetratricopeptide (TPR) repeat protein